MAILADISCFCDLKKKKSSWMRNASILYCILMTFLVQHILTPLYAPYASKY